MTPEQKTPVRILQGIAYFIVGIAIVLLMYVCYLLLLPAKVIEVRSPLQVEPTKITAGDAITVKFKYCKYKDIDSQITIDYLGEAVIPSLSTQRHFPIGCHERNLIITVPTSAPTGEYTLRGTIIYQVNSLREISYNFDTEKIFIQAREQ